MATTFEKLSSNKVKLSFVVAPEKFDEGLQTAYRKMVKKISIPGFRKGKAPMKVIEITTARVFSMRMPSTRSSPSCIRKPSRSTTFRSSIAPNSTLSRSAAARS